MIDKADLLPWRERIDSQRSFISGLPILDGCLKERLQPDLERFRDLLSGENSLFGSQLEKRIEFFIANGTWEELSADAAFFLVHRLTLARQMLESWILNPGEVPAGFPEPPSPNSPSAFWGWLLIAIWHVPLGENAPAGETTLGEHCLMKWIDDAIREAQSREGY